MEIPQGIKDIITDSDILYAETLAAVNTIAGKLKNVSDDAIETMGPGLRYAFGKLLREQAGRYSKTHQPNTDSATIPGAE